MSSKRADSKSYPRGFTLTELVVVISVAAIIATTSARLFHALIRQQTATNVQLAIGNSAARMRDRFTRDANAATNADVTLTSIVLTLPDDEIITWERKPSMMVRTWQSGGEVRNDHFDILAEQKCSFARTTVNDGSDLVTIALIASNTDARDNRYVTSSRGTLIHAELARDHRWVDRNAEATK